MILTKQSGETREEWRPLFTLRQVWEAIVDLEWRGIHSRGQSSQLGSFRCSSMCYEVQELEGLLQAQTRRPGPGVASQSWRLESLVAFHPVRWFSPRVLHVAVPYRIAQGPQASYDDGRARKEVKKWEGSKNMKITQQYVSTLVKVLRS